MWFTSGMTLYNKHTCNIGLWCNDKSINSKKTLVGTLLVMWGTSNFIANPYLINPTHTMDNLSVYETLKLRGTLEGHRGWITSLAVSSANPDILVSGSRDQPVVVWRLTLENEDIGFAQRSFHGHNHIVEDVAISQDGEYILSASWDKSLRLWSLQEDSSTRFTGHTGDVLSCAISADNRLIASASRDGTVKIWTVVGQEIVSLEGHSDWVVSAQFTPDAQPVLISASHDKLVKVSTNKKLWCYKRILLGIMICSGGLIVILSSILFSISFRNDWR